MSDYVRPNDAILVDLTALLATAPWTGMKMHLCKLNVTPDENTLLATLAAEEADFTGYAAQTIVFGAPHLDDLRLAIATALVTFLATGDTVTNSVFVFYATDSASAVLMFSGRLDDAPVSFNAAGDGLSLVIASGLPGGTVAPVG